MTLTPNHRVRIRNLTDLHRGDEIEAVVSHVVHHRGRVLDVAPGLGAVWIRTAAGKRSLIHADEYRLWHVSSDGPDH